MGAPIKSIRLGRDTSDEASASDASSHTIPGRIQSVTEHHTGKHATITVVHGRRKGEKSKAAKKGNPPVAMYDDRPTSHLHIPKSHAKQFKFGQRVRIVVQPEEGDDGTEGTDDGDEL